MASNFLNPSNGPDVDTDCKLHNSYDAQSCINFLAGVSVLLGTVVFFYGYRLSKFTLFLVGFLLAFFFTYVLCNEYLSTGQLSGKTLEYKDQIFLGISAGVGLIAGLLTLCLFYVGLFVLGNKEPAVVQMAESSDQATSEEKDSQLRKIKNIRNGDVYSLPLENQPSSMEVYHQVVQPPDADVINKVQNPNFLRSRPNLATQNSCPGVPIPETASPSRDKEASPHHPFSSSMESPRGSPRTQLNTSDNSERQLGHINAGSFVKDNIVNKVDIMDVLTLHLDRSACPGFRGVPVSKRWEHLADVYKVPDETKRQCDNFTGNQLTPSEAMFECLRTMYDFLAIKTLKSYLKKLGRNDVVDELDKNNNLTDELTVTDLCENHPETLCSVCLKLDDKRSIKNWRHLGLEIGINEGTLRRLKDPSGFSPSEAVLKKIQTLKPRLPTTELADVLDSTSVKLPGIAKVLREFSVSHRYESTIKTLFADIDALEKVTALLDLEENSWQRVGRVYGIDKRLLDSLKPDPIQSPTKVVMEYIVQKEPTLTMKTFLRSLEDIERFDVIEDLKEFFYADDIDGILEARDPLPL